VHDPGFSAAEDSLSRGRPQDAEHPARSSRELWPRKVFRRAGPPQQPLRLPRKLLRLAYPQRYREPAPGANHHRLLPVAAEDKCTWAKDEPPRAEWPRLRAVVAVPRVARSRLRLAEAEAVPRAGLRPLRVVAVAAVLRAVVAAHAAVALAEKPRAAILAAKLKVGTPVARPRAREASLAFVHGLRFPDR